MAKAQQAVMVWRAMICRMFLLVLFLLTLNGCGSLVPSPVERGANAQQMADDAGWQQLRIPTSEFVLTGYLPKEIPADSQTLTVYIEGDGLKAPVKVGKE